MKGYLLSTLAALSVCAWGVQAQAGQDEPMGSPGMERMQNWAADHEAMLDAGLAGLKAGLKLTADQEKLWPPFEQAVRDSAKSRMSQMKEMATRMREVPESTEEKQDQSETSSMAMTPAVSPVDRLDALAQRLAARAAALKGVADAAKPLYASLNDSQKRLFGLLGGHLLMMGHGHRGMGMMGGMGGEMMGRGGMGGMGMMGGGGGEMMGRGGMGGMGMMRNMMGHGMMGPPSNDDRDNSDDE